MSTDFGGILPSANYHTRGTWARSIRMTTPCKDPRSVMGMATPPAERIASERRIHRGDVVLAAVVTVVQLGITVLAGHHQPDRRGIDVGAVALLVVAGLALAGRRRFPLTVLVVVYAATLTYWVSDYPRGPVFFSLVIAFVSAVFYGRRLGAWIMLGAGWVTFLWLQPLIGRGAAPGPGAVTALAAWLLALGTGTEVVRSRRERFAEVARSRAEARRREASEERLQMAQELHDVLAHNISLISVQAGVGLHLLDEQPEQARRSPTAIKDASRDALDELRAVLDVLRRDGERAAPRVPAPRLSTDLAGLVSKTSASGVEVDLRVAGAPDGLPPGVDRAAFRIAQEAL